jgi:hypothetical protein
VSAAGKRSGRLGAVAAVLGVLVILWLATRVRLPEHVPVKSLETPGSSVGLVDPGVIKGTMLRDPTPLFLPSEFNSSRKDFVSREPGSAFAGFSWRHVFDESELTLHLPAAAAVPSSPAEALVGDPPGTPFLGFGRHDLDVQPLVPRGAYVEIMEAGTGRRVFGRAMADARPPSSASWKPMEFMAAVDASGLVGPLVLTVHSNVTEVDAYFGHYLAETLRVGQRLGPGFYRISVGP